MSDMFERNLPQPGERWQHFKGSEYVVIAIATLLSDGTEFVVYGDPSVAWALPLVARHTETDELLQILPGADFTIARPAKDEELEADTAWARPLDNFMGVVSSGGREQASNWYRFERIEPTH